MTGRFARIWIGLAALVMAESEARACSCLLGATSDETKRHFLRRIVISAAVVGRFEVVERADHRRRIGELIRPLELIVGRPRPSYRLEYSRAPCGSSIQPNRVVVLYRPGRSADTMDERLAEERLADRLGEAPQRPCGGESLASARAAIAARELDAASSTYEDGGICTQLFLENSGMLEILREEAARAGRGTRQPAALVAPHAGVPSS